MTLGAHVVETTKARVWSETVRSFAGLSWGNPRTREEMARRLASRDPYPVALQMSSEQSNCAIACGAALDEAGFDGELRRWRGRSPCDPLREPRAGHYDSVALLEQLAIERGARRAPGGEILSGSWVTIGGEDGDHGGATHVVCVVDVEADGTLATVEGGKKDPGNPRPGAKGCTAITFDRREVYQARDGSWWMRDAGSSARGRRVRYWCWTGDLRLR